LNQSLVRSKKRAASAGSGYAAYEVSNANGN
jgi:hypothetical protein